MGAMFAAGQPISEILSADYQTLEYFFEWHKIIQDKYSTALDEVTNAGKKN